MALLVRDEHTPGEHTPGACVSQIYAQASMGTHSPQSFSSTRDGLKSILCTTLTYLHCFHHLSQWF